MPFSGGGGGGQMFFIKTEKNLDFKVCQKPEGRLHVLMTLN